MPLSAPRKSTRVFGCCQTWFARMRRVVECGSGSRGHEALQLEDQDLGASWQLRDGKGRWGENGRTGGTINSQR